MSKGIDIYRYQTVNNWSQVKNSGVTFVYVKHTDGGGPAPVRADNQVRGAKSVGLSVGGYHYAQLSPSPETQADIFINEIERLGSTDLTPMLDLEDPFGPDSFARDFAIRFCKRVAARGYRPGIYLNNSFAKTLRADIWDINPVVWIARYGARPDISAGHYDIHQYSSSGVVPGIAGSVDMNESYSQAVFAKKIDNQTGGEDIDLTPEEHGWLNTIFKTVSERYSDTELNGGRRPDGTRVWDSGENTRRLVNDVRNLAAKVDSLTALVTALSTNKDLSVDDIKKIIEDAVKANLHITGTVNISAE